MRVFSGIALSVLTWAADGLDMRTEQCKRSRLSGLVTECRVMSTEKIHRPVRNVRNQQVGVGQAGQSRTAANPLLADLQTAAGASTATQRLINLQLQANASASVRGVSALRQRANRAVAQLSRNSDSDSDGYSSEEDDYSSSGSYGESSDSYSGSSSDGSVSDFTPEQGSLAYRFAQKGPILRALPSFAKKMRPARLGGPTKSDRKKALKYAPDLRANQKYLMGRYEGYGKGRKRAELLNTTANVADGVALGASVVRAVPGANLAAPATEAVRLGAKLTGGVARVAAGQKRRGAAKHLAEAAEAGEDRRGQRALSTIENIQGSREIAVGGATLTPIPLAARQAGAAHDLMYGDQANRAKAEFANASVRHARHMDNDSDGSSAGPDEDYSGFYGSYSDYDTSTSDTYDSYDGSESG